MTPALDVPPGLRGVVVADTGIGDVLGAEGTYHYRGRSAVDLARTHSFDEAAALVLDGNLPDDLGAGLRAELAVHRSLPPAVSAVLPQVAGAGARFDALAGLRAALCVLAEADGFEPTWGAAPARRRDDALRVVAVTPTVLAALWRRRQGLDPVAPRDDLHGGAAWLWALHGVEPDPVLAAAVERYLVLTIDHGFNASTFTARVAASAGTDVASAVVAAVGTFVGPLHGGAPDRALEALDEIGTADRIEPYVRAKLAAGDRVMGFGHAVYRTADPRAVMLREVAESIGGPLVELAARTQDRTEALLAEHRPGRELRVNVEFWAGVVMSLAGIPREMFTPTFAVSRVVGWCAHVLEQTRSSTIIRPSARYTGSTSAR
ncbi:citrate/2-methylcitrate synthase [Actinomycetospora soli]|uniref:citrate/2-methylcitrate synthase n=1 Tax=Actinomycetospora soli TaxID=2893887 RepID=UPI001E3CCED7|nr:citrate/2-methylcitrate synthase [Actinomycetospora soli]MCD2190385.1 citrate synthase/methylcitrate synthase [Actinomycetospora soli]